MKKAYGPEKTFRAASLKLIQTMNDIIASYKRTGDIMTVRQLYYQLVAKAIIPNTEKSYKSLTDLVNNARLAGLIDWDAIEDRTRAFTRRNHYSGPSDIIDNCQHWYHQDLWENQTNRVFVIVEKEALVGVLENLCWQMDMPLLGARGYPSSTVLREFTERDLIPAIEQEQDIIILHLGDHDPSGIDMTRDLNERIQMFAEDMSYKIDLRRIALDMKQIQEERPPPNPAKNTDSRFEDYRRMYGDSSWELDALSPTYLRRLVAQEANLFIDPEKLEEVKEEIALVQRKLGRIAREVEEKDNDGDYDDPEEENDD